MLTLHIKNMVCARCIRVVRDTLNNIGVPALDIQLGMVQLPEEPDEAALDQIRSALSAEGFELLDDQRRQLIESIKTALIQKVHHSGPVDTRENLSTYLSRELLRDYSSLSRLFSETEGRTIEQYFIEQKIERAKELLVYGESTLSEIAWELGYSSVAHLSAQFSKVTGMSPSSFRQFNTLRRKPLDKV